MFTSFVVLINASSSGTDSIIAAAVCINRLRLHARLLHAETLHNILQCRPKQAEKDARDNQSQSRVRSVDDVAEDVCHPFIVLQDEVARLILYRQEDAPVDDEDWLRPMLVSMRYPCDPPSTHMDRHG
jgi:hypothetical protein